VPTTARTVSRVSATTPGRRFLGLPGFRIDQLGLAVVGLLPIGFRYAPLRLRVEGSSQGVAHELRALSCTTRRDALQLIRRAIVDLDYDLASHATSIYYVYKICENSTRAQVRAVGVLLGPEQWRRLDFRTNVRLSEAEAKLKGQESDLEISEGWEKDPPVQAFADLMNRTLGKPIEMEKIEQSRIEEFRWGELVEDLGRGVNELPSQKRMTRPWRL
jgi:hypothetical protein